MGERRGLPPHRRAPDRSAAWVPWALAVCAAAALGFVGGGALRPRWLASSVVTPEPSKCPEPPVCPTCPQVPARSHAATRMGHGGRAARAEARADRSEAAAEAAARSEKPEQPEQPGRPGKVEKVARSGLAGAGRGGDETAPPSAATSQKEAPQGAKKDILEEPFKDDKPSGERKPEDPEKPDDSPPASIARPEPSSEPAAATGKVRLGPSEEEARLRVWLAERAEALRSCAEQGRHGHGLLSLDVEQSGKVKKARLMAKEGIPAGVERCILERARELRPPVKADSRLLVNLKM